MVGFNICFKELKKFDWLTNIILGILQEEDFDGKQILFIWEIHIISFLCWPASQLEFVVSFSLMFRLFQPFVLSHCSFNVCYNEKVYHDVRTAYEFRSIQQRRLWKKNALKILIKYFNFTRRLLYNNKLKPF